MAGGRIHTYVHLRTHTHAHVVHMLKLCVPTAGFWPPAAGPDPAEGSRWEVGSRCLSVGGTFTKSLVLIKAD